MKKSVRQAISLWQEFHQKEEPSELIEIASPQGVFPKRWGYLGMAKTCYYRSDKWEEDGVTNDYFHDHKTVECWCPHRSVAGLEQGELDIAWPSSLTYLGESLGWDIATGESKVPNLFYEPSEKQKLILCAFPKGEALVVLDVTRSAWRPNNVKALFFGPTLTVEDRGIVG